MTMESKCLRFLAFGDLHADVYCDADKRLDKIIESAKKNKVDFIVSLGDLCYPIEDNKQLLNKLSTSGLMVYHTIGNHDTEHCKIQDMLCFLEQDKSYYSFEMGEYKFIVLDSCYYKTEDGDEHFPNSEKKACVYPVVSEEELKWLKKELINEKKYIIFSHQSLANDFAKRGVHNRAEIIELFKNREVLLCMNGHDHGDDLKKINGILFYTVNVASGYCWCRITQNGFEVKELHYLDSLYVIVELENGIVRIKGMESSYMNEKPENVGVVDYKWNGVSILPKTSSYNV